MKKLIALTLCFLSYFTFASEYVKVRADLLFITNTNVESGKLCFGDSECTTYSTFYLFNAKVHNVILGDVMDGSFKVIYGQHALIEQDINDVVLTLKELDENNQFGALYQVVSIE
ncbi:hypothetical protein FE810_15600 [Thalassotalea litorea]|uniref:Uncharacterized protein n=1 Tax=Thalassotalea litorea TaxID=2020715 RepID=A0A5R9IBW0_9GAMM|nr:hypothetical protein [Thalassotalea litorea]TLU61096.1 hypothetical protein FE810_15600 [Thalassotalea litorea]